MKQLGLENKLVGLIALDNAHSPIRTNSEFFDAIVTDRMLLSFFVISVCFFKFIIVYLTPFLFVCSSAPYGVRAGAKCIGKKHDWQDEEVAKGLAEKYSYACFCISCLI